MKEIMNRQIQDYSSYSIHHHHKVPLSSLVDHLVYVYIFHSQINPIPTKKKKQLESISISFTKSIVGYFLKPVYRT